MFKKFSLAIILLMFIGASVAFYHYDKTFNSLLPIEKESLFQVKSGTSVSYFATQLVEKNWLSTPLWLKLYGRIFPEKMNIKAGTYLISPNTTLSQLIAKLVQGKEHQFSITFIEGTRFKDVLKQLKENPHIKQTLKGKTVSEIADMLTIKQSNPEGWLFPDTYAFTAGTQDIVLLKRSLHNMQRQLNQLWLKRAEGLPYKTAYEALIMASIIEKETSYVDEQPVISSVFVNRLNKRMRLQTDPTVIYGLGDRYQGDITRAHLREKTLYNTYKINGLPPTPIALAGLSAIHATLNPVKSDYFYFVSDGDGKHVFSKTLAEHNQAVRRYLQQQKNRQR